jgi:hypothetical protein
MLVSYLPLIPAKWRETERCPPVRIEMRERLAIIPQTFASCARYVMQVVFPHGIKFED